MRITAPNTVSVSAEDVRRFASAWPCSGLYTKAGNYHPMRFCFGSDGLLGIEGAPRDAEGGALAALSQDAQAYLDWRRAGGKGEFTSPGGITY